MSRIIASGLMLMAAVLQITTIFNQIRLSDKITQEMKQLSAAMDALADLQAMPSSFGQKPHCKPLKDGGVICDLPGTILMPEER